MELLCLSFHHIKTTYSDFLKVRFHDPGEFYRATTDLGERVLFQTGTRVEIYTFTEGIEGVKNAFIEVLAQRSGLSREALSGFFKEYRGTDAARHLFRLSGKIESRVMGETYIPWQVEEAIKMAKFNGGAGPLAEKLFNTALNISQKVALETDIEECGSVPEEAVDYLLNQIPNLDGRTVVLLGAGMTGRKIIESLRSFNPKVLCINRNFDICVRTALEVRGDVVDYSRRNEALSKADILVCATLASHYRVTPKMLESVERTKPLLVIDASPFGNVDPAISGMDGVTFEDRLRDSIKANFEAQKRAVPDVEEIIKKEKLYI